MGNDNKSLLSLVIASILFYSIQIFSRMDDGEFEATLFTTVLVVDCPLERHLLL
jgi:hypothetical protein